MGMFDKIMGGGATTSTTSSGTGTGTTTFMDPKKDAGANSNNAGLFKKGGLILGGIGLVGAVVCSAIYSSEVGKVSKSIEAAGAIQVSAQSLIRNAKSAALGEASGIAGIETDKKDIQTKLDFIKTTGVNSAALENQFTVVAKDVDVITSNKKEIENIDKTFGDAKYLARQVGFVSEELVSVLLQNDAKVNEVAEAERIKIITEKIPDIISIITDKPESIKSYKSLEKEFRGYVGSLSQGLAFFGDTGGGAKLAQDPIVQGRVQLGRKVVDKMYATTNRIVENLAKIAQSEDASKKIQKNSDSVSNEARAIIAQLESQRASKSVWMYGVALFVFMLIGGVFAFLKSGKDEEKARGNLAKADKERTEAAIMRLLQEISELSRGDLRAKATVTEDITGVIADSINLTIDELNRLIKEINSGAASVNNLAGVFAKTVSNISDQSSKQVTGVGEVNSAVHSLTESITQISENAATSAEVAKESLQAAEEGYENVQNTMRGMDAIRDTIQETSKRIKRLGESSQEIGEIADLVSEITEKTNVLALNAFIQAAAAGEQGRGFRVIAGEIQNMAERANESLNKVTALISSIQTDMQEAIAAMEKTANGVVEGTGVAKQAGESLEKIRDISNKLAEIISNISDSAARQNLEANKVSHNMDNILNIAKESAGLADTAKKGIVEVNSTVEGLKKSVERFTVE